MPKKIKMPLSISPQPKSHYKFQPVTISMLMPNFKAADSFLVKFNKGYKIQLTPRFRYPGNSQIFLKSKNQPRERKQCFKQIYVQHLAKQFQKNLRKVQQLKKKTKKRKKEKPTKSNLFEICRLPDVEKWNKLLSVSAKLSFDYLSKRNAKLCVIINDI